MLAVRTDESHTLGMTVTTIKVDVQLRDRLKAQAQRHGRTLGEHLVTLAEDEERRDRFASVRRAMLAHPADAAYEAETRSWLNDAWS
ncbi:hypothetical protein EDD28_0196 [Salana multivorans]|uniref:Arc-like DNA binding dprotein n=2 Tax=Salana multivorans TaxID=120377 RepID=A0A3N2D7A3_9MICO|nr:MAG: hypothetical protein BGO96_03365 [Micrococcales bacterium 73-15]ROR95635.1 hypothetical protein EDD28_0196 [Salana multivorans]